MRAMVRPLSAGLAGIALALFSLATFAQDPPQHVHEGVQPPPIKGNPAFDPLRPTRLGRPGRLLLRCRPQGPGDPADVLASATDFDEGRQSFFLRRRNAAGEELLYPLHGFFLDRGETAVLMIHDGKGTKKPGELDEFDIDQTVNMGLVLLHRGKSDRLAVLELMAEEHKDSQKGKVLGEYTCETGEMSSQKQSTPAARVRTVRNGEATTPSYWYREADITRLTCLAPSSRGYQIQLLTSTKWPGHLGFLVVQAPGASEVGYNVHLLEDSDRLLVHIHSAKHQTRAERFDTMTEAETAVGGLVLMKTGDGHEGWVGIAASEADPFNTGFSLDATFADYASLGHAVVPPLQIKCK